jgi:hypothetical protein
MSVAGSSPGVLGMSHSSIRPLVVALVLVVTPGVRVVAQDQREDPIDVGPMADELVKALKQKNKAEVAIGDFASPLGSLASAGVAIKNDLRQELLARGIKINPRDRWAVVGRYYL